MAGNDRVNSMGLAEARRNLAMMGIYNDNGRTTQRGGFKAATA